MNRLKQLVNSILVSGVVGSLVITVPIWLGGKILDYTLADDQKSLAIGVSVLAAAIAAILSAIERWVKS